MSSAVTMAPCEVGVSGHRRVGVDRLDRVHVMENHDQAYHIWREIGVKDRILVHIDAHHDMWWIDDNRAPTIANFICPALKEGIVREVYWVVPDGTWDTHAGRRALRQHLDRILRGYGSRTRPLLERRCIVADVLGKRLTICSLESLPQFSEPVLLDIDTDYLIIPKVSYGRRDQYAPLPWCWPEDLLHRLEERAILTDLCTVVYSVEGGYTPLKWKFLGEEIAARLKDNGAPLGFANLREGAEATMQGNALTAEASLRAAQRQQPESAAPKFHLAWLCAEAGRLTEARQLYQQAVALDPSYETAYRNIGLQHLDEGRTLDAEREYRIALELDPDDPYAHYGLARIAMKQNRWSEAERLLRRSLTLLPQFLEAHRSLGKALVKLDRIGEAIGYYELSLRMALDGHRPLFGQCIATDPGILRLRDDDHAVTYRELARLYRRRGESARALNAYTIAIAAGADTVRTRMELLLLYAKGGDWGHCASEFTSCLRRAPRDSKLFCRRFRHWLVRGWNIIFSARSGAVN